MPTPKKKPFPLGRVREIAAHVKNLHECLSDVLAEYDAAPTDAPARDNSDAGQIYAEQGQDSAPRRGSSNTAQRMDRILANSRVNASR